MLTRLYISNIVLIEKLNLEFGSGLNILTGETGAGKSILLDALALALGGRSDTGLIRHGCETASVIAEFDGSNNKIQEILSENGIDSEDVIILRRNLSSDGKSRAWVNDVPVSIKTLKAIGDELVEIHGQFANHALLNPATHKDSLDLFGIKNIPEYKELLETVKLKYKNYHDAKKRLQELEELVKKADLDRDYLIHNVKELEALNVKVGEEDELSEKRTIMMNAEKDSAILSDASAALSPRGESLDSQIFSAAHILEKIKTTPNPYSEQIDTLYNAAQILSDVIEKIAPQDIDTDSLDAIEERLFAIRAAARKHRVTADELPDKLAQMTEQLNTIENSDAELSKAKIDLNHTKQEFDKSASQLTQLRMQAGQKLRDKILSELPELKLGSADFMVEITKALPTPSGCDDVVFMIKTNPGMPFAPLHRAASGGELARLMLALRVVLATNEPSHTFIFDEIDTGISGATASAVGKRLNLLSKQAQTLVITHSAQVAGFADKHFKIAKTSDDEKTTTTVSELNGDERINEIARIISGAEITPESLATAKTLIKQ